MPILISGASRGLVNGQYVPVADGKLHNGHALYRKSSNPNRWLRYMSNGKWGVSGTENKDANNNNCQAHSVQKGLDFPHEAKSWKVDDGSLFKVEAAVHVEVLLQQVRVAILMELAFVLLPVGCVVCSLCLMCIYFHVCNVCTHTRNMTTHCLRSSKRNRYLRGQHRHGVSLTHSRNPFWSCPRGESTLSLFILN